MGAGAENGRATRQPPPSVRPRNAMSLKKLVPDVSKRLLVSHSTVDMCKDNPSTFQSFNMGPPGRFKTSASNYPLKQCQIPE
jgi:hypothetical protein